MGRRVGGATLGIRQEGSIFPLHSELMVVNVTPFGFGHSAREVARRMEEGDLDRHAEAQ
jgi:hypothetical protein